MGAIDDRVLADLRTLQTPGSAGFLVELIDLYLKESAQHIATILSAFAARDAHSLERAAHTLKGSSGNLGALTLSRLCAELQTTARTADWTASAALVPRIDAEYRLGMADLLIERAK